MSERKIDFLAAASIVVANMIGTGVFTSLGFQLFGTPPGLPILAIWIVGGVLAFLGALCYAELATRLPEDGGEYYFLSKIYHPALGFMAGFVSATVGFAAPIAMAALALGAYLKGIFPMMDEKLVAAGIVVIISTIHGINFKAGLSFQKIFTILKVAIIVIFIIIGLSGGNTQQVNFSLSGWKIDQIFNIGFAVNLVWVSFAYSGWNASAYIAGEIIKPEKNLSRSILWGALIVTVLYVFLNAVFMMAAPASSIVGVKEVGLVASNYIFGESGGRIMGGVICILLLSTISSMIIAGPRVIQPMFSKISFLKPIAVNDENGNPARSIIFQTTLALLLLFTIKFETLTFYIAFTLSMFTILTVAGMMIMRYRHGKPSGYKAFGYPVTPILFIATTSGVAGFFMYRNTAESLWGLLTIFIGLLMYFFSDHFKQKNKTISE
jgi:APA family basic amino acid/polyamine antiporter